MTHTQQGSSPNCIASMQLQYVHSSVLNPSLGGFMRSQSVIDGCLVQTEFIPLNANRTRTCSEQQVCGRRNEPTGVQQPGGHGAVQRPRAVLREQVRLQGGHLCSGGDPSLSCTIPLTPTLREYRYVRFCCVWSQSPLFHPSIKLTIHTTSHLFLVTKVMLELAVCGVCVCVCVCE